MGVPTISGVNTATAAMFRCQRQKSRWPVTALFSSKED